ncbi:MAG: methyltransferase domain-containing protein [Bacteroidota bacterium]|nr:methyltransferase domain-containing protein [Bacteroidota bacterium]
MLFLKQLFLKNNKVGAIAPSSAQLVKLMTKNINYKTANVIVEFGAGTGAVTKALLQNMRSESKLIVFELNQSFMSYLKANFIDSRIIWVTDSAEQLPQILERIGCIQVDAIISSLPLSIFPEQLRTEIIHNAKTTLTPDGLYVQFQYSLHALSLLKKNFTQVELSCTPFNIPPAVVYTCK